MRILEEDEGKGLSNRAVLSERKSNRLSREKSPYLLQHAFNPVDWYPWGEEAFEKARIEDKPIFLSIGYSTCYWCHVMEREVFENKEIAKMMNRILVSIKVDREERTDIDQIYMTALQSITGSGGWPISIFMTADGKPFYASSYMPPEGRQGNPGFMEILNRIHDIWTNDRSKIIESSNYVGQLLTNISAPIADDHEPTKDMLDRCFNDFRNTYDEKFGGFGSAPKFPRPTVLNFLFRYYYRTGNKESLNMALTTLQKLSEGGIYDRIGGGFHRYSTDEKWHVPHFEKMLYDQAQLVISFLEAFQITHDRYFDRIARDVLKYIQTVMYNPEGGFYSAEDAESGISHFYPEQKKEGAYYIWKKSELRKTLSDEECDIAEYSFGIKEEGNVQPDTRKEFIGENILFISHSLEETAVHFNSTKDKIESRLKTIKTKLLDIRRQRPKPIIDDKILLAWNGLMISAFARASQVLKDPKYLETAEATGRFLLTHLSDRVTGKLYRRYRDGDTKYDGCLTDYAFFIQSLLDLYEASFQIDWLKKAVKLIEEQVLLFYDNKNGGFFENSGSDPAIIVRMKEAFDSGEPSGNSISILNLLRISQILGSVRFHEMASNSIKCFNNYLQEIPQSLPQLLVAVDFYLFKPIQIILAGNKNHPLMREMVDEINSRFLPDKVIILADNGEGQKFLNELIPSFSNFSPLGGRQTAYICHNYVCELPVSNIGAMIQVLGDHSGINKRRN